MTKTIEYLAEEYDRISTEPAGFKCYNCEEEEADVMLDEGDYIRRWVYCPSCRSREKHVLSGLGNRGVDIS